MVHLVYRQIDQAKLERLMMLVDFWEHLDLHLCLVEAGAIDSIAVESYHLPLETYFRLLLPELLPEVERVIYLDIDTMVYQNLLSLWQFDLKGACLAASRDRDVETILRWHLPRIGYTEEDIYINAGVLLLDLQQMRERDLSRILVELASREVENLPYGDQDLLNLYFKDELVILPGAYNYQAARIREHTPDQEVVVVHFNGPQKAWLPLWELEESTRYFAATYQTYQRACQGLLAPDEPLVSLVVEVTEPAPHLLQCLTSLSNQTHTNLDIILATVNLDAETQQVVTQYLSYEERVQHLNIEGLTQLEIWQATETVSRGEYLAWVLASDFLEAGFVSQLLLEAVSSQLVISDYYSLDVTRGVFSFHITSDLTVHQLTAREAIQAQQTPLFSGIWGKLYNRKLLREVLATELPQTPMSLARQLYLTADSLTYIRGTYLCHRVGLPERAPRDLLGYYLGKIAELTSYLADAQLLGLETAWGQTALIQNMQEAAEALAQERPDVSRYLQKKLQMLNN